MKYFLILNDRFEDMPPDENDIIWKKGYSLYDFLAEKEKEPINYCNKTYREFYHYEK